MGTSGPQCVRSQATNGAGGGGVPSGAGAAGGAWHWCRKNQARSQTHALAGAAVPIDVPAQMSTAAAAVKVSFEHVLGFLRRTMNV